MKIHPLANVLGILVDAINMEGAMEHVERLLASPERHYICVAGVHGVEAEGRDPAKFGLHCNMLFAMPGPDVATRCRCSPMPNESGSLRPSVA